MKYRYPTLLLLLTGPAAAQAPADTLARRPPPPAADTLWVQGQPQPARPFLTVQDQLRTVAGVQVTPYDGRPGSGQVVRIRGAGVAQRQAQPLYVVDGLPALNNELVPNDVFGPNAPPSLGFTRFSTPADPTLADAQLEAGTSPLQLLPPEAIARVEVLAGPAAVARYGPLAANGVVSISTRRGTGQPLRVSYAAYGGVQQLRHRYDLLTAPDYARLANEVDQQGSSSYLSFPTLPTGPGTDWQAEAYRPAGLQQHLLSLGGQRGDTGFWLSADYRQQHGLLRNSRLERYGLRLALDQRVGSRLALRGTLALGQTDQTLPYTTGPAGATQATLRAFPTTPVRDAQGQYSRLDPVSGNGLFNPLEQADNQYWQPRTQRLLAQLGARYQLGPHLAAEARASLDRTELASDGYVLYQLQNLPQQLHYDHQIYHGRQWVGTLGLRYQRQLAPRHRLEAELDYSLQGASLTTRDDIDLGGYYTSGRDLEQRTLHRPWARAAYTLDSALTVEASLSYARFAAATDDDRRYYPAAQVNWQPAGRALAPRLWVGAARTSLLGFGYTYGYPVRLSSPPASTFPNPNQRLQADYYTNQLEAGLRLGSPAGRWSAQLVAYHRQSYHALLRRLETRLGFFVADEASIQNLGAELTLTGSWAAGPLRGTSRLAASANRNRLQGDEYAVGTYNFPQSDNQPSGVFYGYRQDGLNADGSLHYAGEPAGSRSFGTPQVLGSGIPSALLGVSQQLALGRLALDVQLDALLGYQVLNYQRPLLDTPGGFSNNATTVLDRWTPTHRDTAIPAAGTRASDEYLTAENSYVSSRLLEPGSHLRLSSLQLSYALRPPTARQQLTLWAGVQNLLVLTAYQGYDPNVSSGGASPWLAGRDLGAVPVPRTWLLGVRASI